MFTQSKSSTAPGANMFAMGMAPAVQTGDKHGKVKPLSPQEKYQQALVTAKVFCEDSEARVNKEVQNLQAVADSSYWFYGYFGANMVATMAASLMIGNRVAAFRRYCGWIALVGGYGGGKLCMGFHTMYLTANVLKAVEKELVDAKRLDEQTQHSIPQYKNLIQRYTQITYKLNPGTPEALAAAATERPLSVDERTDELVEAYMKRREQLSKMK